MQKYLGLDTETCNSLTTEDGKLDLSNSLVYDIGWQIFNRKGKVYQSRSYVVAEIFLDKNLMQSAYYKEKIPQYWEDIKAGKRILAPFMKIKRQFTADRKHWNCKAVFAHNAFFDYNALNVTLRYLTGSKHRYYFPYKLEIWDTLLMARQVLGKNKNYASYCFENNFVTARNKPQMTAEVLYRFLSGDVNFNESHTGLEDVKIESEILKYCLNHGGKEMRRALFSR